MNKIAFFIPAIIFTLFYGCVALGGIAGIHPIVVAWLLLFWIAGILLSKTIFWGGLLGVVPAAYFIYIGTQETGQMINETPIGIVVLLYYAACIYYVYKKSSLKNR